MISENTLTVDIVGLKDKSKRKMYLLFATSGQIYLPQIKEANYLYKREFNWKEERMIFKL